MGPARAAPGAGRAHRREIGRLVEPHAVAFQDLVGADAHQLPAWRGETRCAFSSASASAIAAGLGAFAARSERFTSASSMAGGIDPEGKPAGAQQRRAGVLAEASTSGHGSRGGASVGSRAVSARSPPRCSLSIWMMRGGGLLDRAARHVDDRPAMLGAEPAGLRHLLAHELRDRHSRSPRPGRAAAGGCGGSGPAGSDPWSGRRPAGAWPRAAPAAPGQSGHDRHVRRLDAAVGEIDAGRRLRGAGDADQDDVGLVVVRSSTGRRRGLSAKLMASMRPKYSASSSCCRPGRPLALHGRDSSPSAPITGSSTGMQGTCSRRQPSLQLRAQLLVDHGEQHRPGMVLDAGEHLLHLAARCGSGVQVCSTGSTPRTARGRRGRRC